VRRVGLVWRVLKVRWNGQVFLSKRKTVQKLINYLWLRKSGSKLSVMNYFWHMSRFCHWAKIDPDDILGKTREELEQLVQAYSDEVRKRCAQRGSTAKYANVAMASLKTFCRVNGFSRENNMELRLENYHVPPRLLNRKEYVPELNEACKMAERAGSWRNRAIIYTLYSTGLRNTALRAMIVGDVIKELEAGQKNLLIKVEPEWNGRIPGACKGSVPYYTFTSVQARDAIREMLKRRKEIFGSVTDGEPLFISMGSRRNKKLHLSDRELEEIVKNAAKEAELVDWIHVHPHCLRKVFERVLRSRMKDGGRMDSKDQEFLMGHILPGSQDAYYDWTKINGLRIEYSKLVFTEEDTIESKSLDLYKEMAKLFGINVEDVKRKKETELGRPLTLGEEKEALECTVKIQLAGLSQEIDEQKIIPTKDLQTYLDDDWKFLSLIDPDHVIVKRTQRNSHLNT
jgi:site-specific recombinase XerD